MLHRYFSVAFIYYFATNVVIFASIQTQQLQHTPQDFSNAQLQYLAGLSDTGYTNKVLDNILVPRVVGTPNHDKVARYIVSELEKLQWNVELDEFTDVAPNFGSLRFTNVIATLNPRADRYLTLACHYDSKYFPNDDFVGAIDSAVPCAMMLNLAKVMQKELNAARGTDLSLKLIFFDGEEAFENWGPKDSIYGARHLANRYHINLQRSSTDEETISDLQRIDVLVLLDLIGHRDTSFFSFFPNTQKWYSRMIKAEERLRKQGLIPKTKGLYFKKREMYNSFIEDDHTPFLRRDVPILHLISAPFPPEWHTIKDNRDIVDVNTVENINKILRIFTAEYLHLLVNNK